MVLGDGAHCFGLVVRVCEGFEVMFESKSERMPMARFCKYYIGRSLFPKSKKRATSISSRCEGFEVMFEPKSEMDADGPILPQIQKTGHLLRGIGADIQADSEMDAGARA